MANDFLGLKMDIKPDQNRPKDVIGTSVKLNRNKKYDNISDNHSMD